MPIENIISFPWITFLPDFVLKMLPGTSLLIVGYLVEKNFVGRIATFCNALAINLHLVLLANPQEFLIWYANLGLLMGLIGIVAYQFQSRLTRYYYWLSWLYSSIVVGLLILFVH